MLLFRSRVAEKAAYFFLIGHGGSSDICCVALVAGSRIFTVDSADQRPIHPVPIATYIGKCGNETLIKGCDFIYSIPEARWIKLNLDKLQGLISDKIQ